MRLLETWREAFRNISSGTARGLSNFLVFICLVGTISALHTFEVVSLSQKAQSFQEAGAATFHLSAENNVNTNACENLPSSDGVKASGALIASEPITLEIMPQWNISSWQVTPGIASVFDVEHITTHEPNLWVSQPLAERLGLRVGDRVHQYAQSSANRIDNGMLISGVFEYPDDGRDGRFAESFFIPTHAGGLADICIATFWPDLSRTVSLLGLVVEHPSSADSTNNIEIDQLNRSLGNSFTADMPSAIVFSGLSFIVGLIGPLVLLRPRKLELASALHAGVNHSSLWKIQSFEWLAWILPGATVVLASILWFSTNNNPDPYLPALISGVMSLIAGVAASYLGSLTYVLTAREKHLFKLFRQR